MKHLFETKFISYFIDDEETIIISDEYDSFVLFESEEAAKNEGLEQLEEWVWSDEDKNGIEIKTISCPKYVLWVANNLANIFNNGYAILFLKELSEYKGGSKKTRLFRKILIAYCCNDDSVASSCMGYALHELGISTAREYKEKYKAYNENLEHFIEATSNYLIPDDEDNIDDIEYYYENYSAISQLKHAVKVAADNLEEVEAALYEFEKNEHLLAHFLK